LQIRHVHDHEADIRVGLRRSDAGSDEWSAPERVHADLEHARAPFIGDRETGGAIDTHVHGELPDPRDRAAPGRHFGLPLHPAPAGDHYEYGAERDADGGEATQPRRTTATLREANEQHERDEDGKQEPRGPGAVVINERGARPEQREMPQRLPPGKHHIRGVAQREESQSRERAGEVEQRAEAARAHFAGGRRQPREAQEEEQHVDGDRPDEAAHGGVRERRLRDEQRARRDQDHRQFAGLGDRVERSVATEAGEQHGKHEQAGGREAGQDPTPVHTQSQQVRQRARHRGPGDQPVNDRMHRDFQIGGQDEKCPGRNHGTHPDRRG